MSSIFGSEFDEIWPKSLPKYTEFGLNLLRSCENIKKPKNVNFNEVCKQSSEFSIKFPIETCRIQNQPANRQSIIEEQINSVYPVIHERVLWLYTKFLEYKREYGTRIEKEIYINLSLIDFVQRLLCKRCASFYGRNDKYLLLNGESGISGFTNIGTENETYPLLLRNCLSYDEIKLSALLSVSSHTEFINDGNRKNCGKVESNRNLIETDGVIIGLIGARLSRKNLMEYQDIIISKSQNTIENGFHAINDNDNSNDETIAKQKLYRQIWNEFYNEESKLYKNVQKDGKRFGNLKRSKDDIFDNLVMKKRYTISFDTLLIESEMRSKLSNKKGYIHVVGIGLGVWCSAEQQEKIFLETFSQRIKALGPMLKHVSYIHFSWFKSEWNDIKNNAFIPIVDHPDGGVRIFVSKRNPADKLKGTEFENCLIVVSYAWDGNALPGNEFWMGLLSSTGDSSSACSTLISELHNPHINKTKVCGENLHIASEKHGILHIADYVKKFMCSNNEK